VSAPPPAASPRRPRRARTLLAQGRFDELRALAPADADPEDLALARLALAALEDDEEETARALRRARRAEASRRRIARALLASARWTLAGAAQLLEDDDAEDRTVAAGIRDLARRGVAGDADALKAAIRARARPAATPPPDPTRFDAAALRAYAGMRPARQGGAFTLLEVKSLPRSGLHYLVASLGSALGPAFDSCEWYQEPGCCHRMPCTFTEYASGTGAVKVRLTKSHDLDLADPVYPPRGAVRRLVLVRDPLYVLTSYFLLDALETHREAMEEGGLDIRKLYYRHEPPVVRRAHAILARVYRPPEPGAVRAWLDRRAEYVTRFVAKWSPPQGQAEILHYDDMAQALPALMGSLGVPGEAGGIRFSPRSDPFDAGVDRVAEALRANRDAFVATAERIRQADAAGILRPAGPGRAPTG
jgi:hypothetical protein